MECPADEGKLELGWNINSDLLRVRFNYTIMKSSSFGWK